MSKKLVTIYLKCLRFVSTYSMNFIFVIAVCGTFGSLYFSEVLKLVPCNLCWYQRVVFYPILPISAIGLFLKDKNAYKYIFALAMTGFPIAVYQHLLKVTNIFGKDTVFCRLGSSCSDLDWELIKGSGITLPFLSALGFLGIIIFCLIKYLHISKK
jgi:disulfide bond formation protein DsbB